MVFVSFQNRYCDVAKFHSEYYCYLIINLRAPILQGVVVFGLLYHEPLRYNDYLYPSWAEWIGWGLALSSILMIPIFMVSQLLKASGTFKEVYFHSNDVLYLL